MNINTIIFTQSEEQIKQNIQFHVICLFPFNFIQLHEKSWSLNHFSFLWISLLVCFFENVSAQKTHEEMMNHPTEEMANNTRSIYQRPEKAQKHTSMRMDAGDICAQFSPQNIFVHRIPWIESKPRELWKYLMLPSYVQQIVVVRSNSKWCCFLMFKLMFYSMNRETSLDRTQFFVVYVTCKMFRA